MPERLRVKSETGHIAMAILVIISRQVPLSEPLCGADIDVYVQCWSANCKRKPNPGGIRQPLASQLCDQLGF